MDPVTDSILLPGEKAVPVGGAVRVIDNGHGLCWGTDAYLLASFLRRRQRLCELGSGCGVVSFLAAAHRKADTVVAFEANADACDRTRRGILLNGLDGSVSVYERDIREVKFTDPECGGRFDCVCANPPYIAHPGPGRADAAADDARHENRGGIADFCAAAARLLKHRGSFCCVWRPERLADLTEALRACRLEPKRMVYIYPDAASAPSLLLCEAVLGAAPGLCVARPLIFFASTKKTAPRAMSDDAEKIYAECSFDCFFAP